MVCALWVEYKKNQLKNWDFHVNANIVCPERQNVLYTFLKYG